jgi:hypothetical protein
MDRNEMSNLYRGPSIDASYQVLYHLAKWLQRKSCFRIRPIRNKILSFLKAELKVSDTDSAHGASSYFGDIGGIVYHHSLNSLKGIWI